ncbi:hypothetical protein HPB49_012832 [Dermacentor silvarum]|uniref:Uncharacterized protein n=1 Tax=Dermacentor silvarum TaxID=543639 RepID=A0ACB8CR60_DERSI|nr:hypothetical protein HPB49_012832 [Dermacentor silvarum]
MLTYVWTNTPREVVANCFRHSGFVHDAADLDVVADVESGEERDGRYVNIMLADVLLCDYVAIDNDVAVAGKVTDSDIVAEVMDGEGESADEYPNDSDEHPSHTMTEAAHAFTVLEDICMVSSDSSRSATVDELLLVHDKKHVQKMRSCQEMESADLIKLQEKYCSVYLCRVSELGQLAGTLTP